MTVTTIRQEHIAQATLDGDFLKCQGIVYIMFAQIFNIRGEHEILPIARSNSDSEFISIGSFQLS